MKHFTDPDGLITSNLIKFESGISAICVSDYEKFIAIGSDNGHIHLYEATNFLKAYKYHEFSSHTDKVTCFEFRKKDNMMLSSSLDGNLIVYCLTEN